MFDPLRKKTWGRRPNWRHLPALASICAALLSCTPQPLVDPGPATLALLDSPQSLIAGLQRAGAEVATGEQLPALPGTRAGQVLRLADERVAVYPVIHQIQPTLLGLGPGERAWRQPGLLVIYAGDDGGTILLLSGLLGDPLVPSPPAQDEPYPPAVAVAIVQAAERLGVTPAQVEVLAFAEQPWLDDCLGLPPAGQTCSGGPLDGWRIELQIGLERLTVHTDWVGGRLRFAEVEGRRPAAPWAHRRTGGAA